jgi:hypothetical protein
VSQVCFKNKRVDYDHFIEHTFWFLQGAISGSQSQVYESRSAGPPPSPERTEVGMMMMGAMGLSKNLNMDMQQLVMRPTGSGLSLSLSGLSGDDSGDYYDCTTAVSSMLINADPSWGPTSPDSGALMQARDSAMLRYKEKKKNRKYGNQNNFNTIMTYSAITCV